MEKSLDINQKKKKKKKIKKKKKRKMLPKRVSAFFFVDFFGQAKVGDHDVALAVEENVFRLQVAVDNVERVQVRDRRDDFGRVEAHALFGKSPFSFQVEKEFSTY